MSDDRHSVSLFVLEELNKCKLSIQSVGCLSLEGEYNVKNEHSF